MGIFSSLSKLFSSPANAPQAEPADAIEYKGYVITPTPMSDQGQYRVSALITKGEGEAQQTHTFIRSDLVASRDECIELTTRKAKLTIDQLGEQIF
ncbi:Transcriptional activator HlyU [Marinomonas aquimarina]|uniref:Transcriptional activator HlyU n=1 Tax=Marinomonas aquimarina TaxID=295068 RepID=A0A1A8TGK3_9GAMM|nr:HlyU family transcriptional regulator [Marinomonas aquimarina]SBS32309.1 Transcriptional activator HlyU [Marinomonas aquimarina]